MKNLNKVLEKLKENYETSIDGCIEIKNYVIPISILEYIKELSQSDKDIILNTDFCIHNCNNCEYNKKHIEIINNFLK